MKSSATARGAVVALAVLAVSSLSVAGPAASAEAAVVLKGISTDGDAFDLDEYADGDVVVQTQDGGRLVDVDDARDLQYVWRVTPYDTTTAPYNVPAVIVDEDAAAPGQFVVPLPADRPSGTYTLRARLTGDRTYATVLIVDAGQAELALDAPELGTPWWLDAGQDNDVSGSLLLEDGTPLVGRPVDLAFIGVTAGGDDTPDAAFVPSQVPTAEDGTFTGVLSDTPGEGTELGGTIEASWLGTTSAARGADLVSRVPADGSTLDASGLGAGTPGEALPASVTVTDGGGDPVEGQVVTVELDHGFLTSDPAADAVAGDRVGDLQDLGTTLTALTDADGRLDLLVGIGRDEDFDDDGEVAATLTATAGDLTDDAAAAWSTADSLNGQVVIEPSPADEQDGPVTPTVSGQRTYLEVHAQDQFGNRIAGAPIALAYGGNLDDFDYSDDFTTSDFDTDGDIWVASFEGGDSTVTGSWAGAPVTTYAGGGAVDSDTDTVTGSFEVGYYDIDFRRSTFAMSASPRRLTTVGTAVTHTVRVTDQMGNPVQGWDVEFFRFGPDRGKGEVRKTVATNQLGEARYTFVGNRVGTAQVTAEVTDGVRSRTLTGAVDFREPATLRLTAGKAGAGADELTMRSSAAAGGAKVVLYRANGDRLVKLRSRRLDDAGSLTLTVPDRNGRQATTYVAKLRATDTTDSAISKRVTLR